MLLLQFRVGREQYALLARQVVEVVPIVNLREIPGTPDYIAGVMNYRGHPVPVLDLCSLALGKPCQKKFSTRIILVRFPWSPGCEEEILGLVAEQTSELIRSEMDDFKPCGVYPKDAPYLKGVKTGTEGMVQWIDVAHLIPKHVCEIICRDEDSRPDETASD